jgi:hypothetical protein
VTDIGECEVTSQEAAGANGGIGDEAGHGPGAGPGVCGGRTAIRPDPGKLLEFAVEQLLLPEGRPALLEVNPRAPGSLALTIASGVDMPRLALAALRGEQLPGHVEFYEKAVVRYLEEHFLDLPEVIQTAA